MSIRIDRLVTLCVFHPLAQRTEHGVGRIPILMYHAISDSPEFRNPYFQTNTSPARFAEQMQALSEGGYTAMRLTDALGLLENKDSGDGKPVVITFDDAYRSFHTQAFPVLARYGFGATVFLPTGYIGENRATFNGKQTMTWGEIRELDAAGVEFGSHTVSHPQLCGLPLSTVEQELRESKDAIEDRLGKDISLFSYPFAFPETRSTFVTDLRSLLVRSGYRAGVSTVIGTSAVTDDPMFLKRLPVNTCDDPSLFRAKLEGGYDWLHSVQQLKKTISGAFGASTTCPTSSSRP